MDDSANLEELRLELQDAGVESERSSYLPSCFLRVRSGLQKVLQSPHMARFAFQVSQLESQI